MFNTIHRNSTVWRKFSCASADLESFRNMKSIIKRAGQILTCTGIQVLPLFHSDSLRILPSKEKEISKIHIKGQVIHVKVPYSHPHNPNPPYSHPYLTMKYMPKRFDLTTVKILKSRSVGRVEETTSLY